MAVSTYRRGNSIAAQVQVRPYPVESKSFKIPGRGTRAKSDIKLAEAAAAAWAKEKERELELLALKKFSATAVALTVAQLIDAYLASSETKQLKSWKDTDQRLGFWVAEYGQEAVIDFYRSHHIRAGRDRLHAKLKTPATVNRYLRSLSSAWSWGQTVKLIAEELAWPKRGLMLKEPPARDRFLTDAERVRLLQVAAEADPVMRSMIVVGLATGSRQDNLLTLKWNQVDIEQRRITFPTTKNGRPHAVHLASSAIEALNALKAGRIVGLQRHVFEFDGEAPRQDNVILRFRKLCKAAGIPIAGADKITFHSLRHSCASYLAEAGASLLEIGTVLGHRSPAATARYAHLVAGKAVTGSAALDARLSGKSA
jgi:integrase